MGIGGECLSCTYHGLLQQELELELEACKKEVARERTRILEHEQSIVRDEMPQPGARNHHTQHHLQRKAQEDEAELAAAEARYKSAVEEKKGMVTAMQKYLD